MYSFLMINVYEFFKALFMNAAILVAVATIFNLLRNNLQKTKTRLPIWETGLLFGISAVITMLFPVATQEGIFFDFRTSIITIAALINGPLVALIAVPLPILYRIHLGGIGVYPGIAEIIIPAILASALHIIFKNKNKKISHPIIFWASFGIIGINNLLIVTTISIIAPETLLPLNRK